MKNVNLFFNYSDAFSSLFHDSEMGRFQDEYDKLDSPLAKVEEFSIDAFREKKDSQYFRSELDSSPFLSRKWGVKRKLVESQVCEDDHLFMRQIVGKQRKLNDIKLSQNELENGESAKPVVSSSLMINEPHVKLSPLIEDNFLQLNKTLLEGGQCTLLDEKNLVNKDEIIQQMPQDKVKQVDFFSNKEPEIWYPLNRNTEGQIEVTLPNLNKDKKLIYAFRNRKKACLLIGKTGGSLNKRISGYIANFNKNGSENKVKKEGRKTFLSDVKKNPEDFDVGILHVLTPDEDLEDFETLFIQHKGLSYALYNDNDGGGGGCVHSEEEATTYAMPKPGTLPFTPVKYYRFQKNAEGNIRPQFSPGFKEKVSELREGMEKTQAFLYAIKDLSMEQENKQSDQGEKRYIGVTGREDPSRRAREHCYGAEYYDPSHTKYDPSSSTGYLHPAIAAAPEKYGFGLLPLQSIETIPNDQRKNYILLNRIAEVESYTIALKKSHVSQNGFNGNYGGGGPIAKRTIKVTESSRKKLKFDTETFSKLDD